ncbi:MULTISPECIES: hypothetical protein [Nostoc]|uniref:Uncharacterized protein n=1 Tax=Nostoc paludosum FACHB-159 TaxID=2692908 RepID=A0ABR8KDG7_9NOSO|nr:MULTISPECIES: hypothetical protein [Nostoc]MBD2681109.1 hypothetical protein [Nostoc sp. FACHB-857]MBD2737586.1 hypothetical protein [Nostoc paludosum FACHB-159]
MGNRQLQRNLFYPRIKERSLLAKGFNERNNDGFKVTDINISSTLVVA